MVTNEIEPFHVYLMTNEFNRVIYTGVTSKIKRRIWEHKKKVYPRSFTARYNVTKLVYLESHQSILIALQREKQIKAGSRKNKIALIERDNPRWLDLAGDWYD